MKKIVIFNDISGLGNCSLCANIPVFTQLGHYCMPIPTACYSCQTGFEGFEVLPNVKIGEFSQSVSAHISPDAAYVGFCSDNATLKAVDAAVSGVLRPKKYLFVDPIMGDNGRLYPVFDGEYVETVKRIVKKADCISPNLTEACFLYDVDYAELTKMESRPDFLSECGKVFSGFLDKVGCKSAVITGIKCGKYLGNMVLDGHSVRYVTNERSDVDFSGTGDLFSAVLLGEMLKGLPLAECAVIAADFVGKSARLTERTDRRFGVDFCKVLSELK